ncbi:MAG: HDIG domain-containing metalloprotein [Gemmataceae bacterium]
MFASSRKPSRIGQWDGRRRSSRSEEPVLPRLWEQPVQLRLGTVLVTAIALTVVAFLWGPAYSYRPGQIFPHDIRARVYFEIADVIETARRRDEAVERLSPEDRCDAAKCENVRLSVQAVIERYPPGALLVSRGQPITEQQMVLLKLEQHAYNRSLSLSDRIRRLAALFLVFTLLASVAVLYVVRFHASLAESFPKVVSVCSLVFLTVLLGMILAGVSWQAILIPLTMTAMILTIAYNPQFALLMSLSLTLTVSVALGGQLGDLLVAMGGQTMAILSLRHVRTRMRLIEVGAMAGLGYVAMTLAVGLYGEHDVRLVLLDAGRSFVWGTLAGFLVSGLLPLVERIFGIVTDVSLLELSDGSHPLLQELVRRSPGTYTHSMTVATLAEPAAEAISANPLLVRVGSYFHDIGKMLKPHYFIENQTGENRHNDLEPALSTLIIIGHVKDGVALAEQYGLPEPIVDFIRQHHGTTLVEYFYRAALRLAEESGTSPAVPEGVPHPLESTFRYPGPKPQTREAAVVMLADAVESASRAMSQPTPASLRKLVRDLSMKRLLDGQFAESGLTLTELHQVEEALVKGLIALYHNRIKYPEAQRKAG